MRSRVEVTLKNGEKLIRDADERYRGGPDNPLSDKELKDKFNDCTQSILAPDTQEAVVESIFGLDQLADVHRLIGLTRTTL